MTTELLGLSVVGGTKILRPQHVNTYKTHTAEVPDGTATGSIMQGNQSHILHYRFGGPCHWSAFPFGGITEQVLYIITHFPERRNADSQKFAVCVGVQTETPGLCIASYRDSFGGVGAYTDIISIATDTGYCHHGCGIVSIDPPSGIGADSMKVWELKFKDGIPVYVTIYPMSDLITPEDQYIVPQDGCSAGKFVISDNSSYSGLIVGIGDGSDDVESMERLTRRTFFNQAHPDGTYVDSNATIDYVNMFTSHEWAAKNRDLLGDKVARYAYPAAVIKIDQHHIEGSDDTGWVRFYASENADSWEYEIQDSDPIDEYFLITPWRTGSSSSSGLLVSSGAEDSITISGKLIVDAANSLTLTIAAWALFEGPAY